MSTMQITKDIIKSLNLLAEKDFVVVSTDFTTGQVVAYLPGFEPQPEANNALVDKKWGLTEGEKNILRSKNKIEGIKALRERLNLSLADAKAIADRYTESLGRGEAT